MPTNSPRRRRLKLACLKVLAGALTLAGARAATTNVYIDPSQPWNGFENVYYRDGTFWTNSYFPPGTAGVLQGSIDSAGTVICSPDLRMDRDFHLDTNAWADASGTSTGVCRVVSTYYLDSTTLAAAGDTVVFSGTLATNALAAPYSNSIMAFIKDFDANWVYQGMASINFSTLTSGQPFTVSRTITATGAGNHVQWGFEWSGPPARSNAVAGLGYAMLVPAPKPRGASVPWTTYEAEDMTIQGGTVLGRQYFPFVVTSESSGRRCVRLTATGQYLQFTARAPANAVVVRHSVPDTADGVGADYTLSLYKNGSFVQKLAMTSRHSWLYGDYPFTNNPAASPPRNFYDEVRLPGVPINAGDTVRLQKDAEDAAAYYTIDLVDLEDVADPLPVPVNSLSITSYGAVGDGAQDCTAALGNCISAAQAQGKTVWIPAGTYLITGNINLPSNTTIQGAGMWHTKLIGSAGLYNTTPSRRLNLNGSGSNIRLADFAILGFLKYRNDSEGNDGLGGAYGAGSSISRIWVEHTKAGAWILNSSGLVIEGCRFRNTLADGININRGMRGTIVTNCTSRGTGDDGFAIWPSPGSQTYPQGMNVITHCTAETPFLANGGAIYGGDNNRIEDCLFQDITYGCAVLISTTFPVGGNVFSGTTVVQRSDLVRCGGYDAGFSWRAALQVCLQGAGISGLLLKNLNLSNNVSDGMSIIYGAGALSNAVMSNVDIPDYGAGVSGRHGLWARNDAVGSLTISSSTVIDYLDSSPNFTFNFVPGNSPTRILSLSGDLAFGGVVVGGSSNRSLIISNAGNSVLTISAITCPAGFSADWSGLLPAGGTTNIAVSFHPSAMDLYTGELTINSDATGGTNAIAVSGHGVAKPSANFNRMEQPAVNDEGDFVLTYHGVPGYLYTLERTASLSQPIEWIAVSTNVAAPDGLLMLTNSRLDPANYFRIREVNGP